MNLLKDHSFYLKCEEYDLQFENELTLSTSQWMNYSLMKTIKININIYKKV